MAKISEIEVPSLLLDEQGSDPTTPATGFWRFYAKATGIFHRDDAGAVTGPLIDETAHDALDHTGLTGVGGGGVGNLWTMNKSSSQTLTSNTLTQITFDTTVIDGGSSVIDLANDRFVAPATGFYLVICTWLWEATAPNVTAHISVKVGSVESIALIRTSVATASMGANTGLNGSGPLSLTSGDFVTMWCHPGGAVTPTARGNASVQIASAFSLVRIT